MKLLIAEKPSVALSSYKPLLEQMENESFQKKDGYIEGKNWCISWCIGHLVGLSFPDEYEGWDAWSEEVLPMFPMKWKYTIQSGTSKQFKILSGLINRCSMVVNGADAGREGELIFRRVMEVATTKRIEGRRLWINSFVMKDMIKGWKEMKDSGEYQHLYDCAMARAKSDWLVGMNFSRGYILRTGIRQLSVGRVQTPTLALIVKRDNEVENWVESFFYELIGKWQGINFNYYDAEGKEFESAEVLEELRARLTKSVAELTKKEVSDRHTNPPKPFDLLKLQKEANSRFDMKAHKTLKIAQELYEKKLITYPRTDSEYLPESMKDECFQILDGLLVGSIKPFLKDRGSSFSFFNNSKVSDHYAIIPTGQDPDGLSEDEMKLFQMIRERYITAFCKPYRFRQTDLELNCSDHLFKASVKQEIDKGFKGIKGNEEIPSDDQIVTNEISAEIGDRDSFTTLEIEKKKRSKPKYYTEGSLLTAMETAGKKIEEEELREAMKGRGLGTPATRSSIFELLKKREYVSVQGKYLVSTEKGRKLIEIVSEELASAELTGEWEFKLKQIEKGKFSYGQFMQEIEDFVVSGISEIKKMEVDLTGLASQSNANGHKCPSCKSSMKLNDYGVFCTSCEFKIWRKVAGKKLSDNMLERLLTKGETTKIKGLKGAKGKFDCKLVLQQTGSLKFKFD